MNLSPPAGAHTLISAAADARRANLAEVIWRGVSKRGKRGRCHFSFGAQFVPIQINTRFMLFSKAINKTINPASHGLCAPVPINYSSLRLLPSLPTRKSQLLLPLRQPAWNQNRAVRIKAKKIESSRLVFSFSTKFISCFKFFF